MTGTTKTQDAQQLPAIDGIAMGRWLWANAKVMWSDLRQAPIKAAMLVAFSVVIVSTVLAFITTFATTFSPFAAVDAAFGTFFGGLFGYAAAMGCAAVMGGLVATLLAFVLPRRLLGYHRQGATKTVGKFALIGVVWAIVLVTMVANGLIASILTLVVLFGLLALTAHRRARKRVLTWLLHHLGEAGREMSQAAAGWKVVKSTWDKRRMLSATVEYPGTFKASDKAARLRAENSVKWAMSFQGDTDYGVYWTKGARNMRIVAEPPVPFRIDDELWPVELPGIVLGITTPADASAVVTAHNPDGTTEALPVLCFNFEDEEDMLVAGPKGAGKTVLMRRIILNWMRRNPRSIVWIFDGKGGSDWAYFDGMPQVKIVARNPLQWKAGLNESVTQMRERYDLAYEWQGGRAPKPDFLPELMVFDELQAIVQALGDEATEPLDVLARMARGAKQRLLIGTQRPDTAGVIPGAIRDQITARVALGWMSMDGATMMVGPYWRVITGDSEEPIERAKGRGVALINGKLIRTLQVPYLPTPVENPKYAWLYPERSTAALRTPTVMPKPVPTDVVPVQRDAEAEHQHELAPTPATAAEPQLTAGDGGQPQRRQRRTE